MPAGAEAKRGCACAAAQLREAMNSHDAYEVREATEVLHELQLEERAARVQAHMEEATLAAADDGDESAEEQEEEGDTKEVKVVKQMEELSRIRSEKAARLMQAYMRGFITRRLMKNILQMMERCRQLWEYLGVAPAAMEAQLATLNVMRLRPRTHELRLLQTRLEAQAKAKEVKPSLHTPTLAVFFSCPQKAHVKQPGGGGRLQQALLFSHGEV